MYFQKKYEKYEKFQLYHLELFLYSFNMIRNVDFRCQNRFWWWVGVPLWSTIWFTSQRKRLPGPPGPGPYPTRRARARRARTRPRRTASATCVWPIRDWKKRVYLFWVRHSGPLQRAACSHVGALTDLGRHGMEIVWEWRKNIETALRQHWDNNPSY